MTEKEKLMENESEELYKQKMMFEYVWNWFSYHAKQRLSTFNFFLIIIGGIGFLFTKMINNSEWLGFQNAVVCCICGFFFFIVSKIFYEIECRNHELVNCGREALDRLERKAGMYDKEADDKNFSVRRRDKNRQCLPESITQKFTHTQAFKKMFVGLQCIGLLMIILGFVCFWFLK